MFTLLIAAALALVGSAVTQNTTHKAVLFNDLGVFNAGLSQVQSADPYPLDIVSWKEHKKNTLPAACYFEATRPYLQRNDTGGVASRQRCALEDVDAWDITYSDCPTSPFTICICSEGPISARAVADEMGRLPIGLRQEVSYVMAMPDDGLDSGMAYTRGNWIIFQAHGHGSSVVNPAVMIHEAAHAQDFNRKDVHGNPYAFSRSKAYKNAIDGGEDWCWADPYAQVWGVSGELSEPWAQTMVLRRVQQEEIDPLDKAWCMRNQLRVVGEKTDELLSINVCNEKKVPAGPVLPINIAPNPHMPAFAVLKEMAKLPVKKTLLGERII